MFHEATTDCCVEGGNEGSTKEKIEMSIIPKFEAPGHLTVTILL